MNRATQQFFHHRDFTINGTGPTIKVFGDRIEITNPDTPLIDTLRFIDEPPRSRNEVLAAMMRRLKICEEPGSGIDKVVFQVELFQLPAPDFQVTSTHTKAILYALKELADMDQCRQACQVNRPVGRSESGNQQDEILVPLCPGHLVPRPFHSSPG